LTTTAFPNPNAERIYVVLVEDLAILTDYLLSTQDFHAQGYDAMSRNTLLEATNEHDEQFTGITE